MSLLMNYETVTSPGNKDQPIAEDQFSSGFSPVDLTHIHSTLKPFHTIRVRRAER